MEDEQAFKQDLKEGVAESKLIDAGTVFMMMTVEGKGVIPIPVPDVFQQLFAIMNHFDGRLAKVEVKLNPDQEEEKRILTLN